MSEKSFKRKSKNKSKEHVAPFPRRAESDDGLRFVLKDLSDSPEDPLFLQPFDFESRRSMGLSESPRPFLEVSSESFHQSPQPYFYDSYYDNATTGASESTYAKTDVVPHQPVVTELPVVAAQLSSSDSLLRIAGIVQEVESQTSQDYQQLYPGEDDQNRHLRRRSFENLRDSRSSSSSLYDSTLERTISESVLRNKRSPGLGHVVIIPTSSKSRWRRHRENMGRRFSDENPASTGESYRYHRLQFGREYSINDFYPSLDYGSQVIYPSTRPYRDMQHREMEDQPMTDHFPQKRKSEFSEPRETEFVCAKCGKIERDTYWPEKFSDTREEHYICPLCDKNIPYTQKQQEQCILCKQPTSSLKVRSRKARDTRPEAPMPYSMRNEEMYERGHSRRGEWSSYVPDHGWDSYSDLHRRHSEADLLHPLSRSDDDLTNQVSQSETDLSRFSLRPYERKMFESNSMSRNGPGIDKWASFSRHDGYKLSQHKDIPKFSASNQSGMGQDSPPLLELFSQDMTPIFMSPSSSQRNPIPFIPSSIPPLPDDSFQYSKHPGSSRKRRRTRRKRSKESSGRIDKNIQITDF